jgi:hypothetical protein
LLSAAAAAAAAAAAPLCLLLVYCRSFDRSIEVRRPDYQGRLEGIKVHLREKPIAADIDYSALAALTGGMSGAQLAGKCACDQTLEPLLHVHDRFAEEWWNGQQVALQLCAGLYFHVFVAGGSNVRLVTQLACCCEVPLLPLSPVPNPRPLCAHCLPLPPLPQVCATLRAS